MADIELKSGSTNLTNGTVGSNLPIERVEDGHYAYRRGSTTVHVQAYAASSAGDVIGPNIFTERRNAALNLWSGLQAMIVVIITLVIKISATLATSITERTENEYMLSLYVSGFMWFTYYLLKGFFRQAHIKFSKTNRSSNRWLKGVLVLFGLAVVMMEGLQFLSYLMVNTSICKDVQIKIAVSFFHALFIVVQVKYLFKYSKVYIQNCSSGSRTGLMYIIAVNLSFWIAAIIDETVTALNNTTSPEPSNLYSLLMQTIAYKNWIHTVTTTIAPHHYAGTNSNDSRAADSHSDPCACHTTFCTTVHAAEKFLFPFAIEFSLVASSLLYITWANIGKRSPPCEGVVKPSYKFYAAYTGAAVGGFALFVAVVIVIILGTSSSSLNLEDRSYFSEISNLVVYHSFLIGLEVSMLLACFYGFYLFRIICRPLEKSEFLDQILLIICLIGPMASNIFSLLAVIAGPDNKVTSWGVTLVGPLVDILQCIFQIVFLLYGLQREPIVSMSSKEIAEELKKGITDHLKGTNNDDDDSSSIVSGFDNKTYLRSRRASITSVVSALANNQPRYQTTELAMNHGTTLSVQPPNTTYKEPAADSETIDMPQIVITSEGDEEAEKQDVQSDEDTISGDLELEVPAPVAKESILKIVKVTRVARPDKLRCRLRDIVMFLLITNATLWVFMSLDGTAFTMYPYQTIFFGSSAWTTIIMICRPLSIFYRMHSAGCLFEIWSFA
ncbi:proton channel OTOP2-like [Ciona intestinalis]